MGDMRTLVDGRLQILEQENAALGRRLDDLEARLSRTREGVRFGLEALTATPIPRRVRSELRSLVRRLERDGCTNEEREDVEVRLRVAASLHPAWSASLRERLDRAPRTW